MFRRPLPYVPCAACKDNVMLIEGPILVIVWEDGSKSPFCNQDCKLNWMVANNATFASPNPQPDVS